MTRIPVEGVDEQLGGRKRLMVGRLITWVGTDSDQLVWDWSGNINCGFTAW